MRLEKGFHEQFGVVDQFIDQALVSPVATSPYYLVKTDTPIFADYCIYRDEQYLRSSLDSICMYVNAIVLYDGDIVTCPNGIGMKIPDWQPFSHVLDEIFTMKWYGSTNLKGLTVTTSDRLLQTLSLYFESLGAEVYAYEPDEQRSALAEENISLNGKEKAIHLFKQLANALMASRLIEDKYLTNVFLKIDCEGCEFEIIGNLPEATLKRVNQVVLEYHANPKTFQRLEKADFRVSIDVGILWAHKTT